MGCDRPSHIRDLVGAVPRPVMVEGVVAPGTVRILKLAVGSVPEGLVVGRGDVIPDVGEVEIVGARVRALDQHRAGGEVLDQQDVELIVVGKSLSQRQAIAIGQRLKQARHGLELRGIK